jgi:hypothetical protein
MFLLEVRIDEDIIA